jgi:hypothetical protein
MALTTWPAQSSSPAASAWRTSSQASEAASAAAYSSLVSRPGAPFQPIEPELSTTRWQRRLVSCSNCLT